TTLDRWHQMFYYLHLKTGTYDFIRFYLDSWNGILFLDNFRIYQANPSARTVGFSQTEVSATLRNLDGYLDPTVPYAQLNFSLWDRTAQSQVDAWTTYTDYNGYAYYNWQGALEQKEYLINVTSITNTSKSYFTPLPVNYTDYFDSTLDDEIDFSEGDRETVSSSPAAATMTSISSGVNTNGSFYIKAEATASSQIVRYSFHSSSYSIDADYYTHVAIRVKTNNSNAGIYFYDSSNTLCTDQSLSTSYQVLEIDLDNDWTGTETAIHFAFRSQAAGNFTFTVDYIRLIHVDTISLFESSAYFLLVAYNVSDVIEDMIFRTWSNQTFSSDYFTGEWIPKNLSTGPHSFEYCAFMRWEDLVYLPTDIYQYEYTISEEGIMKILIHDQSGKWIPPDNFEIYIDGTRLYEAYVYFTDTSQRFNLTIADIYGYQLYSNASEVFEEFKEVQLNLFSTKLMNVQDNPIYLYIERSGGATWSEWVYPFEIVKYYLASAQYNFTIVYCDDLGSSFGAVSTNGTVVEFIYTVNVDTALLVTGYTIQDVFDNIITLQGDLDSANSSIHVNLDNTRDNITIQLVATNQNITFIAGNLTFIDTNMAGNFTIVTDLLNLLNNSMSGNFTLVTQQLNFVLDNLTLIDANLFGNFTFISNVLNLIDASLAGNFTLITDLLNTMNTTFSGNFTIINDKLTQLLGLARVHFTFYDQYGVGLPWETAIAQVNVSRIFDPDIWVNNNTQITVTAYDFFDTKLFNQTYLINRNNYGVNISVTLWEVAFRNTKDFPVYLQVYKENYAILGFERVIEANSSIKVRMLAGSYDYEIWVDGNYTTQEPIRKEPLTDRKLLVQSNFKVSKYLPATVDVFKKEATSVTQDLSSLTPFLSSLIGALIGGVLSLLLQNLVINPTVGRHIGSDRYAEHSDLEYDALDIYGPQIVSKKKQQQGSRSRRRPRRGY
ncbi:MAG: hypothetical protein ACFFDT_19540, partial [Candidatus Hodarchaeota archaeon]